MSAAGKVRVTIAGPSPGELRFQATASATAIDGALTFVCVNGQALDGQSGWLPVPGDWTCGPEALVWGYRTIGQPLDAWSAALPRDSGIKESIEVTSAGLWRWTYRATSPFAGRVTTRVLVEPATGRVASATRSDGVGKTDYTFDYGATFPTIAAP